MNIDPLIVDCILLLNGIEGVKTSFGCQGIRPREKILNQSEIYFPPIYPHENNLFNLVFLLFLSVIAIFLLLSLFFDIPHTAL